MIGFQLNHEIGAEETCIHKLQTARLSQNRIANWGWREADYSLPTPSQGVVRQQQLHISKPKGMQLAARPCLPLTRAGRGRSRAHPGTGNVTLHQFTPEKAIVLGAGHPLQHNSLSILAHRKKLFFQLFHHSTACDDPAGVCAERNP